MKSSSLKIVCVCVSAFLLAACVKKSGAGAGAPEVERINITFAGTEAGTTGQSRMMYAAAARLNESGRFNARVAVNGSLAADPDTLVSMARSGEALVVPSDPGRLATQFALPDLNILMAPYILTDTKSLRKLPETSIFKGWQATLLESGIFYITNMYNGFRSFYTIQPVLHVSDLKGLRIRGFNNDIGLALAGCFGYENVGIPWGEVPAALEAGSLDGCEVQVAAADGARLYDFVKNLALTKHYMLQSAFVCSADFYNSLGADERNFFVDAICAAAQEYGLIIEQEEAGFYNHMRGKGVSVNEVDIGEFQSAVAPLYANNDLKFSPALKERLLRELAK